VPAVWPAEVGVKQSPLVAILLNRIEHAGLPLPVEEWPFSKPVGRRHRFDLCYPDRYLGIEVDGGTWSGGRHTRGAGFQRDCEKTNLAQLMGYRVLRFTRGMIEDGTAVVQIRQALEGFDE
jgi:hypothetical protein